ncbi:MAG: signal recognition particle-docking protein FtsY [Actinomycetota bacterium]
MGLFGKLISKITGTPDASNSDWQELEDALVQADLGPNLVQQIVKAAKSAKSESAESAIESVLRGSLSDKGRKISRALEGPTAILVVGVNGTGKTTSTAKLANFLSSQGDSVLLAAADTFRAAAVDQLRTWGERLDIDVVHGVENADPASVAFDAAQQCLAKNSTFLIVDTAGRMHTKNDLMDQLGKVKRVIEKVIHVEEILLVVDATTGQNGLIQARQFAESVPLTGILLTKMDGSARGGIALAIENELKIPIKFVGTGESATDFAPFDSEGYIRSLL